MRYTYSPDIEAKICAHEDGMVAVYSTLLDAYRSKMGEHGCDIRLERYWYNNGKVSSIRLPFTHGYICAFSCSAERNGEPLCVDIVEGFTLTASWPIVHIEKLHSWNAMGKSHLTVSLFNDTDDAVNDLNGFLKILEDMD